MADNKDQLVDQIASMIHEKMNISPLASKIYSLLIFSSYDGLSFNYIKDKIKASKSSISVNINTLLDLGYIEYYIKSGDRKRFFKAAKYFYLQSLKSYQLTLQLEVEMLETITNFNKKHHPDKYIRDKSIGDISLDYLHKTELLVQETVVKLEAFRKSEEENK